MAITSERYSKDLLGLGRPFRLPELHPWTSRFWPHTKELQAILDACAGGALDARERGLMVALFHGKIALPFQEIRTGTVGSK